MSWDECFDDYEDESFRKPRGFNPLPSAPNNGKTWLPSHDDKLSKLYTEGHSVARLAEVFGRTQVSICYRLNHLGLSNDPDLYSKSRELVPVTKKPTATKKVNLMHTNMQHLIALLQQGYTTVSVKFFGSTEGSLSQQIYTYKAPVSAKLAEGDLVVVPARKGFATAKVHEVHESPQIDVKEPLALRWIVQKVDTTAYDDQTAREEQAIKMLEQAERKQAQEEALKALLGSADREALLQLIQAV